jgi:hypothetical protein
LIKFQLNEEQEKTLMSTAERITIDIAGVNSELSRTIVSNVYIGKNELSNFLYNFKEKKVMGRAHSEISDFIKYEVDGKVCYYAKATDIITVNNKYAQAAKLSYFIDEDNTRVSPIRCSLDPHNKFISANSDEFDYDELVSLVKLRLIEEITKEKEDEAMQLKLSYKHR